MWRSLGPSRRLVDEDVDEADSTLAPLKSDRCPRMFGVHS